MLLALRQVMTTFNTNDTVSFMDLGKMISGQMFIMLTDHDSKAPEVWVITCDHTQQKIRGRWIYDFSTIIRMDVNGHNWDMVVMDHNTPVIPVLPTGVKVVTEEQTTGFLTQGEEN